MQRTYDILRVHRRPQRPFVAPSCAFTADVLYRIELVCRHASGFRMVRILAGVSASASVLQPRTTPTQS